MAGPKARKSSSKKGAASSNRKRNPLKSIENNAFDFDFVDTAEPKKPKRGLRRKAPTNAFAPTEPKKAPKTKKTKSETVKQVKVTKARTEPKPKKAAPKASKTKGSRKKRKHQSAKKHADAFADKAPKMQVGTPKLSVAAMGAIFSPGDASCESGYSVKSKRRLRTDSPATPAAHLAFEVSLEDLRDTPPREVRAGKTQAKKKTQVTKKLQRDKRAKARKVGQAGKVNISSEQLDLSAVSGYGSFISPPRHLSSLSQSREESVAPIDDIFAADANEALSSSPVEELENLKVEIAEEPTQETTQADVSPTALLLAEHKQQRRKKNNRVKPILNEAQMAEMLEQAKEEEEEARRFYDEIDNEPLESFFEVC